MVGHTIGGRPLCLLTTALFALGRLQTHPLTSAGEQSLWFGDMSAATDPVGVRRGAAPDPHIVELGKLMLGRAPKLGEAMADLLCREIDAYSDGTVVTQG